MRTCLCRAFCLVSAIVSCRPPCRFGARSGARSSPSRGPGAPIRAAARRARRPGRSRAEAGSRVPRPAIVAVCRRHGEHLSVLRRKVHRGGRIAAGTRKVLDAAWPRPGRHGQAAKGALEHRSVATLSGTSGARRDTHERDETQAIAGKDSHGAGCINDASGVRTKRRRASSTRFLTNQATAHCKPLQAGNLARAALERQRPPRTCGNMTRTTARLPGVSIGSTR